MIRKKLGIDSYRVGWICPLEVEQVAAMQMLDEQHEPLDQAAADHNVYKLGSINGHNVVIAGLYRTGNCAAATVVTQMRMTFSSLRYILLVGIGGGVPVKTDRGMVRLGHVVVGTPTSEHSGVIQYDHGKAREGYFERTGFLMPPPTTLLSAARNLAVGRAGIEEDPVWTDTQRFRTEQYGMRHFRFPGRANDHLYHPEYSHREVGKSCEEGRCSPDQRLERSTEGYDESFVVVHQGTIASGEMVIKDAQLRDRLAQRYGLICFEMEAVGALADFPCMVIRGISDYCDSHKNDDWHGFAAAAAAAYARQLFFHMPIESAPNDPAVRIRSTAYQLPRYTLQVNAVSTFVAREKELKLMEDTLQSVDQGRRAVVLHGLGGIGKTQLAIQYGQRHREEFSTIIWLDASDQTTLEQSFARLAARILQHNPSVSSISSAVDSRSQSKIVAAVKRWLDEPDNNTWMIMFDNYDHPVSNVVSAMAQKSPSARNISRADSFELSNGAAPEPLDIRGYLPEADHGTIIITSRLHLKKLGVPIRLNNLEDLNDSLEILVSTTGRENMRQDPAAASLARRLEGLPLALASAGAYMEEVQMTCAKYLELYEQSWLELHETTPELPSYDKALCSTWNISYENIKSQSETAALLLQQWAYFDSKDLWYELLKDGRSEKPKWLADLTRNELMFTKIMRILCTHGIAQADAPGAEKTLESAGYSVHACVHSWMKHVLNEDFSRDLATAALDCVSSHIAYHSEPNYWLNQRRIIRHADQCYETIVAEDDEFAAARGLRSLGYLYKDQGQLSKAEAMYRRALEAMEMTLGPEHTSTLDVVSNLGVLHKTQGRLSEADILHTRVLRGRERAFGPEHPSTLDTYNNLGILYKTQGRLGESEVMHKKALKARENIQGPEHSATLDTISNLGVLYKNQGRLDESEVMHQRALEGREKVLGPEHISTLDTVSNLGVLYKNQGRFTEAEKMHKRALQGREKALGPQHISTLDAVHNLGLVYMRQNRYPKATETLSRALHGREEVLGHNHIATLDAVYSLGSLYRRQAKFSDAAAMYERALKGYDKALGTTPCKTHVPVLNCLENFGILRTQQGRLEEARAFYLQAKSGLLIVFGAKSGRYRNVSDLLQDVDDRLEYVELGAKSDHSASPAYRTRV